MLGFLLALATLQGTTHPEWNPPAIDFSSRPLPVFEEEPEIERKWYGDVATLGGQQVTLKGQVVNQINGVSPWRTATFEDVRVVNPGSMFAVGVDAAMPPLMPGETFFSSSRPQPWMGWMAFRNCYFGPTPGDESWQGYGGKMWLHPQSNHSLYLVGCNFAPVREHAVYAEWPRHIYIDQCFFMDTGGNPIQIASRLGDGSSYVNGNPLCPPAGWNGWAVIRNIEIREKYHGFRDASDISFFGFMGPIVLEGVRIHNTVSALAIQSDTYKGTWVANGDSIPWSSPRPYRQSDGDPPEGVFTHKEVWVDDFRVLSEEEVQNVNKPMLMFSGIGELNIGTFEVPGRISINNEFGGPFPCGEVRFYDAESVWAHEGRIGTFDPELDKFRPYNTEELEALIVQ